MFWFFKHDGRTYVKGVKNMKCVILLDFKNKLYAATEMHVDVHA